MLNLKLGPSMNPDDIEEGDDVYFECDIKANPAAYKVVWKHNVRRVPLSLSSTLSREIHPKLEYTYYAVAFLSSTLISPTSPATFSLPPQRAVVVVVHSAVPFYIRKCARSRCTCMGAGPCSISLRAREFLCRFTLEFPVFPLSSCGH